jgi:hypothetical protein
VGLNSPLNVHTAEITTAAVEIKTLTVRGKQVTQGVFRQLEEQPLVLRDATLAGLPWGRINYHPDRCAESTAHWHIVWQDGPELRRARVSVEARFDLYFVSKSANEFISGCMRDEEAGTLAYFDGHVKFNRDGYVFFNMIAEAPQIRICGEPNPEIGTYRAAWKVGAEAQKTLDNWTANLSAASNESLVGKVATAQEKLDQALASLDAAAIPLQRHFEQIGTTANCYKRLAADVLAEEARRERHVTVRRALADLPQLFIAV